MSDKVCKKCGRPLPEKYKHKVCESCRIEKTAKVKKGLKGAAGVAGTLACVTIAVIAGGHVDYMKK